ncbi:MAG: phosphoglucosamine mutase [Candidatus Aminicenantes bacterium]|nr:phosphoglucosamine mutase [Candidatus Aminicenantes bacterium]
MKLLKIGISGVRGIVGETITPELVMNFACAFGTYINSKPVLMGRDTRISGPMLHSACISALTSTGCDVIDLGICPTPILQYMVKKLRAKGAISITAGHNDIKWNALIFINQEGTYLNTFQGEEVLDIYHLGKFAKASTDKLGRISSANNYSDVYFKNLSKFLDVQTIKKADLKVIIDPCNGAGAKSIDALSQHLNFELVSVNNEPNGFFPHDPEPRPRNAQQVASIIKVIKADVGFILNSDVSRVSLVAENGETLSEEYALPLIASHYLKKTPGAIITNFSTSKMIEDVAQYNNCTIIKTKVGQSHSIQTLIHEDAVMAGEGSGGIAIPEFQPTFDGFLTIGLILEIIAKRKKKISQLIKELPKYHIVKEKIYCPPTKVHSVVNGVKKLYPNQEINDSDGIRVDLDNGWVHIRASVTEPMIRIIAEDKSKEGAQESAEKVINFISSLLK